MSSGVTTAELALAVKAVASALQQQGQANGYQRVYAERYRRYQIGTYKALPHGKCDEAIAWLKAWHAEVDDSHAETSSTGSDGPAEHNGDSGRARIKMAAPSGHSEPRSASSDGGLAGRLRPGLACCSHGVAERTILPMVYRHPLYGAFAHPDANRQAYVKKRGDTTRLNQAATYTRRGPTGWRG